MFYEGCTIEEIKAFRELENEVFDFGEGPMEIEGLLGSEDVYYKMALENYNDYSENCYKGNLNNEFNSKSCNSPRNNYFNKMKEKKKLDKLYKNGPWWAVYDNGDYKVRCYKGKNSKYLKKMSNKKIRRTKEIGVRNKGNYKKIYDYWWNLF